LHEAGTNAYTTRAMAPQSPLRFLAYGVVLALGSACASAGVMKPGFEPGWKWNGGRESRALLARLGEAKQGSFPSVAVGVGARGVVGRVLPTDPLWRLDGPVDVLPSISGDSVAWSGGGNITVVQARDGQILFRIPSHERRLEGYSWNGQQAAFLLVDADDARPDLLLLTDSQGRTIAEVLSSEPLGPPHLAGATLLVPWAHQYVSAFDAASGAPVGRLLIRSAITQLQANSAGLFALGARGVVRITSELGENPDVAPLGLPKLHLPGDPVWPPDGSEPRRARATPVMLSAEPVPRGGRTELSQGHFVAHYYQLSAGFSADGVLDWVVPHVHALVGSGTNLEGTVACLEDGSLVALAWQTGSRTRVGALGERLKACAVSAGTLPIPSRAEDPKETQVYTALQQSGSSMAAFHDVLLDALERDGSATVTATLLSIARDPALAGSVSFRAAQLLATRREGLEVFVAALRDDSRRPRGGDAANPGVEPSEAGGEAGTQTRAAPSAEDPDLVKRRPLTRDLPLGPIAKALGQSDHRDAAPLLASYLVVPLLSGTDAEAILGALERIGTEAEVPQFQAFISANKGLAPEDAMARSLGLAAKLLVRRGEVLRAWVTDTATDKLTHPKVRSLLQKALRQAAPAEPAH
jgi:hypothetical protein